VDVFVTGANGFVGLNIVSALVEAGHRVTAYVRPKSNTAFLEPMGVNLVRGTLDDTAALGAAMRGAQGVIHTAGNTSCNWADLPALTAANVDGTQNVVNAAVANGVKRLVYTSTTSTIGATSGGRPSDEAPPLSGFRSRSPYAVTKRKAEEIVLSAAGRGVECVILNPAEVIGPYDYNMQWGRMVMAVFYDQVPFVPPGGGSFCSAIAVGRAHALALEKGRSGERYVLGGDNASYATFIQTAAKVLEKTCRLPSANYTWLYVKAVLQEKGLMGGKPAVEAYRMRVFGGTYFFDSAKAAKELGYQSSPLEQQLRDCADWYRGKGFFKGA
jgi:dihydroflavonol-4-reductase